MRDSAESWFYRSVEELSEQPIDEKLQELKRYARVSFLLDVNSKLDGDVVDSLVLRHCGPKYSRSGLVFPDYDLGKLTFSRKKPAGEITERGKLACPSSDLRQVGSRLSDLIKRLETPPAEDLQRWQKEANGIPVAIHGVNYFNGLVYRGAPLAPGTLLTYTSNDATSQRFLERLPKRV